MSDNQKPISDEPKPAGEKKLRKRRPTHNRLNNKQVKTIARLKTANTNVTA